VNRTTKTEAPPHGALTAARSTPEGNAHAGKGHAAAPFSSLRAGSRGSMLEQPGCRLWPPSTRCTGPRRRHRRLWPPSARGTGPRRRHRRGFRIAALRTVLRAKKERKDGGERKAGGRDGRAAVPAPEPWPAAMPEWGGAASGGCAGMKERKKGLGFGLPTASSGF
jgi:hypothetical protein